MTPLRTLGTTAAAVLAAAITAGLVVELLGVWGAHVRRRTLVRELEERRRVLAMHPAAQRSHASPGAPRDANRALRPYAHTPEIWEELVP